MALTVVTTIATTGTTTAATHITTIIATTGAARRIAPDHRGSRVADYHNHHLKPPPRGHEWRRVDNTYVLIAVATGLITSVVAAR